MNVYVGNLPFDFDSARLSLLFERFGEVLTAQVVTDRATGRSRGFGFVEMPDEAAKAAIAELEGSDLDGRRLTVGPAKPRSEGYRTSSSGGPRRTSSGGRRRW